MYRFGLILMTLWRLLALTGRPRPRSSLAKMSWLLATGTFCAFLACEATAQQLDAPPLNVDSIVALLTGGETPGSAATQSNIMGGTELGRSVVLDLKIVQSGQGHRGTVGHWAYDQETHRLYIYIDRALVDQFTAIDLASTTSISPPVSASDGVVTFKMRAAFMRTYGVAIAGSSEGWQEHPAPDAIIDVAPSDLSAMTTNLSLHLAGHLVPMQHGQSIQCVGDFSEAVPSAPVELRTQNCYVGVQIVSAAILQDATGTLLSPLNFK